MSVLIKGMEMPQTCDECLISGCTHSMLYIDITDRRSPNCPLVEIPTPHGRLIDADVLINNLATDKREVFTKHQVWLMLMQYGSPTVIESEE